MINYDLRRIRLLAFDVDGVLSAGTMTVAEDGIPMRTANIKDGYALHLAVKMGFLTAIITGGSSEVVRRRYEMLGIRDINMGCSRKIENYDALLAKYGLTDGEVLYMGDDIPDLEIMHRCGCACAPRDAAAEVRDAALYVSHIDGGMGCVRDVVEQVLKAQGKWLSDEALTW